ncbi:MAG: tetraacyldisaccharide 4'-kinase [Bacteroidales bacterium]|nr:tetraacyldisaccharide 4'-kinase [Bacteroidales bacterium]
MSNFDPNMNILLLPISFLYQIILKIRHKIFDWHLLKSKKFDLPVICVGNLSFGGTGKTPHTEQLIRLLKEDYRVATLSRGYGRKTRGFRIADDNCTSADIGDEPMLYFRKYPNITVAVDEDRVEGVQRLLAMPNPPQVILLDDAMQHRRLQAGLTLLLTEWSKPYCDDFLVPAGTLRDVRSAARRADVIVVSKTPKNLDDEAINDFKNRLGVLPQQQVFFSSLEHESLQPMNDAAHHFGALPPDSALLFCGIANPNPLISNLRTKINKLKVQTFNDHHRYDEKEVNAILETFEALEGERKIIITTEKDYARLEKTPYLCIFDSAPLFTEPIKVSFNNEELFNSIIRNYVRENTPNG